MLFDLDVHDQDYDHDDGVHDHDHDDDDDDLQAGQTSIFPDRQGQETCGENLLLHSYFNNSAVCLRV